MSSQLSGLLIYRIKQSIQLFYQRYLHKQKKAVNNDNHINTKRAVRTTILTASGS